MGGIDWLAGDTERVYCDAPRIDKPGARRMSFQKARNLPTIYIFITTAHQRTVDEQDDSPSLLSSLRDSSNIIKTT